MSATPSRGFTYPPSLAPYNISPAAYLAANPGLKGLVVSAIIIHNSRVLLIQRAAHDGFPLKWECPGGGVDTTDATILHAVCREVHEETGLVVTRLGEKVNVLDFDGWENGAKWTKITFLVVLDDGDEAVVRLNAQEHQDAVWATDAEVASGMCEGREIVFAYGDQKQLVLDALSANGK
ncbi:NUDIX hydrolase domain-like protein [Chaetomium strumarium]|uniref:NUDIX hydrolase domain-like protein n=1 Tax=Chaetomium strumarium TaxID=1170767 RepID=A0AAJ0LZU8_9PEZI|nr:NUDIX hydrolase domain-like protein [Chaetomium strumarium]